MGRKSKTKPRRSNPQKRQEWSLALFPFFQRYGIKQVSMIDIAKYLNRSKPTLYDHFESQEDIIQTLINSKTTTLKESVIILEDQSVPYLQRFSQVLDLIEQTLAGTSHLFLSDLQLLYPSLWKAIMHFPNELAPCLKRFYLEGIQADILINIDPEIATLSDCAFFKAAIDPSYLSAHNQELAHLLSIYFKSKLFGLVRMEQRIKRWDDW